MASLPSPTSVAGAHLQLFETLYNAVDPHHQGRIEAMDAAKFLKRSHLSDIILSKIWDMADPTSRGFLDKPGMFVALKLCALAQQGHDLNISNVQMDIPPPKMGDMSTIMKMAAQAKANVPKPVIQNAPDTTWTINTMERVKYEQLFKSLGPIDGYVPGNKVKGVLMDSKLPLETLGRIWDLADIDKDGKLNEAEFMIAMHLVYKALEKKTVPNVLPPELMASIRGHMAPQVASQIARPIPAQITPKIAPQIAPPVPTLPSQIPPPAGKETKPSDWNWIVPYEDLKAADKLFVQADQDMDGFVSGLEIKDVFVRSGLPQTVLAQIWGLCDISQSGKLNNEQFALAMFFIREKLGGKELPNQLTTEMIPPSFRKNNANLVIENNNACSYANAELNMLAKEISEIIRERHAMEQDISQKEADIKIKNGEIKSLQSELDTLAATLRQLDNQKNEAQKRLNDLKLQVDKLRQQATDHEATLRVQEEELEAKRQELESVKIAEQELENKQRELKNKLDDFAKNLQNTQLQISTTKANITQLEEQQRQILDAITQYDSALAMGDVSVVPDSILYFQPKLDGLERKVSEQDTTVNDFKDVKDDTLNNNQDKNTDAFAAFDNKNDISNTSDPFAGSGFPVAPENVTDPFGEDPFAALHAPVRGESPSPALPPKVKTKVPPPRPAPPRPSPLLNRPTSPDARAVSPDPFGDKKMGAANTNVSSDFGFADFADFDQKA